MARLKTLRSVRGRIVERWVFNFRVPPSEAARMVPVPWLTPLLVDGSAVFSFCPYRVDQVRIGPLAMPHRRPMFFSAARLTVIDTRDPSGRTVAWVPGRESSALGAAMIGALVLGIRFRRVTVAVHEGPGATQRLTIGERHACRFSATIVESSGTSGPSGSGAMGTRLFATTSQFERFFECGVSRSPAWRASASPAPAIARLDLDAPGTRWSALEAMNVTGDVIPPGANFDSAFRGVGGAYHWSAGGDDQRLALTPRPTPLRPPNSG